MGSALEISDTLQILIEEGVSGHLFNFARLGPFHPPISTINSTKESQSWDVFMK
jgi:hypothetical protein